MSVETDDDARRIRGVGGLRLICPVFVPLVAATGLPSQWKAILSGALAPGIPEILWVAAAAVMGKAGFDFLKQRVFDQTDVAKPSPGRTTIAFV